MMWNIVETFEHNPGAFGNRFQRIIRDKHRQAGFFNNQFVKAFEQRAAAGDRGRRDRDRTARRFGDLLPDVSQTNGDVLVLSGATGLGDLVDIERGVLAERLPGSPIRAYGTMLGHSFEAQMPAGVALAAGALARRTAIPPFDSGEERPADSAPRHVVVTSIGHLHGEGVCHLETIEGAGS
mgnify:CR=1 FL=1